MRWGVIGLESRPWNAGSPSRCSAATAAPGVAVAVNSAVIVGVTDGGPGRYTPSPRGRNRSAHGGGGARMPCCAGQMRRWRTPLGGALRSCASRGRRTVEARLRIEAERVRTGSFASKSRTRRWAATTNCAVFLRTPSGVLHGIHLMIVWVTGVRASSWGPSRNSAAAGRPCGATMSCRLVANTHAMLILFRALVRGVPAMFAVDGCKRSPMRVRVRLGQSRWVRRMPRSTFEAMGIGDAGQSVCAGRRRTSCSRAVRSADDSVRRVSMSGRSSSSWRTWRSESNASARRLGSRSSSTATEYTPSSSFVTHRRKHRCAPRALFGHGRSLCGHLDESVILHLRGQPAGARRMLGRSSRRGSPGSFRGFYSSSSGSFVTC